MPAQRSNGRYQLKRKVPGIGKVRRSLRTDHKGIARRRENAVLALAERGQQDVVRAWLDGDVSIAELHEAHEAGTVHELATRIRRADATLADACRDALRDKAPDVADSTLSGYKAALRRFRAFAEAEGLEGVREALTTDTVQAFKGWCQEEHEVAKETINNYLTAVSVLVTYAERQGWIEERPEIKTYESTVRISYLDADDLAAYFAELRPAFRPLMRLLVGTGLRLGEAEDLTPARLRLSGEEARALVPDSKSASGVRTVFIPESAAEVLRHHLQRTERGDEEAVFQIPRRTVQEEHRRARERIGRPSYTIHDHRHTAAVHLARAGMPLHLLQRQLGHANIDMTMRYATFSPAYSDVERYFDAVDRHLGLRTSPTDGDAAERVEKAAELLGVDPDALGTLLDHLKEERGTDSGHSLGHTPSQEDRQEVEHEPA